MQSGARVPVGKRRDAGQGEGGWERKRERKQRHDEITSFIQAQQLMISKNVVLDTKRWAGGQDRSRAADMLLLSQGTIISLLNRRHY